MRCEWTAVHSGNVRQGFRAQDPQIAKWEESLVRMQINTERNQLRITKVTLTHAVGNLADRSKHKAKCLDILQTSWSGMNNPVPP